MRILLTAVFIIFLVACDSDQPVEPALFTDYTAESGITFKNELIFTERFNPYTFRNFYNGAGVAVGDINNDGRQDIYFAGNQVDNKLYLNLGDLKFKDITDKAGVSCKGVWSSGVTFVDINSDGFLDLYVCKSGDPDAAHRNNELFVNNGDLTFTEKSKEYGLDITGLSVQAAFFDYDKDGDLDCYLLTNSIRSVGNYDLVKNQRDVPDAQGGGNKFFLNENGKFRDYSTAANIYRSNIGFGLGITLGDFNNDSWTDIFVSNDFFERDYLYLNNQHGGFKESLTTYFNSISMGSMGADFADLDNDGNAELFVTEMLPDSLNRKKAKAIYESWNKYQLNIQNGYYEQFPRNVLQKKISDVNYAEVGRLAGVAASEWSWGALLFDMDNDGRRDIFIANGIYKDLLDRDYLTYTGEPENVRKIVQEEKNAILKLIDLMPTSTFPNYAFRNEGNLNFKNLAKQWGLGQPMFSSGSAYGDFDNDGDLDLVVNNLNAPAVLYRNNTDSSKFKSITISLTSKTSNTFEVGSHVTVFCGTNIFVADNFVTRGFQSSVQTNIGIGLGQHINSIDSILIKWPEDGYSVIYNVSVNKEVKIRKEEIKVYSRAIEKEKRTLPRMELVEHSIFKHNSSGLIDFNRDRLLPMMYSNETPSLLKGDINGDGTEELYIGGGKDQPGKFIVMSGKKFLGYTAKPFEKYGLSEETKGTFFDADGDGDLDFYMATGGRFFPKTSSALEDIIYFNNGKGEFNESPFKLPFTEFFSTSVARSIDFDNDGDLDLLVCERFEPFVYGLGGRGYLLENNGKGLFKDVTQSYAPGLLNCGMITDAVVVDFDGNGWKDLIIVGDWMPVTILKNDQKLFTNISDQYGLANTKGWWHAIETGDFNADGKPDFVLGNHGRNTFFKPGDRMYVNDFDQNGSTEQIYCTRLNDKYYPILDKDEFLSQLPSMKKSLLYFKDYSKKSMNDLFDKSVLDKSKIFDLEFLPSILLLSTPQGFEQVELPLEAQYSPIYSFLVLDFDKDGVKDIIAGGNQYQVKPQFGRYDASNGWFFKGVLKDGHFGLEKGIDLGVKGQIRDIEYVEIKGRKYILFAKYDSDLEIYKIPD